MKIKMLLCSTYREEEIHTENSFEKPGRRKSLGGHGSKLKCVEEK
jgi:hypothetical protein